MPHNCKLPTVSFLRNITRPTEYSDYFHKFNIFINHCLKQCQLKEKLFGRAWWRNVDFCWFPQRYCEEGSCFWSKFLTLSVLQPLSHLQVQDWDGLVTRRVPSDRPSRIVFLIGDEFLLTYWGVIRDKRLNIFCDCCVVRICPGFGVPVPVSGKRVNSVSVPFDNDPIHRLVFLALFPYSLRSFTLYVCKSVVPLHTFHVSFSMIFEGTVIFPSLGKPFLTKSRATSSFRKY